MTKITNKAIREYLGHNGWECRVRVKRDGMVERYGSPDPFDRSKDFWAFMGPRDWLVSQILWQLRIAQETEEGKELG